jgi:hypothetical protein
MLSNIDFTYSSPSNASIFLTNGTTYCLVSGCAPGNGDLVQADYGTSFNKATNNVMGASFSDLTGGSNSLLS